MEIKTDNKHKGTQVKRFREAIGMKQETLAKELGMSQQNISYYEKQEDINDELFEQIAKGMGVAPEVLKDYNPGAAFIHINEVREHSQGSVGGNVVYNFNPLEKILEQGSKIEELYKKLLQSERDKIDVLTDANKSIRDLAEKVGKLLESK